MSELTPFNINKLVKELSINLNNIYSAFNIEGYYNNYVIHCSAFAILNVIMVCRKFFDERINNAYINNNFRDCSNEIDYTEIWKNMKTYEAIDAGDNIYYLIVSYIIPFLKSKKNVVYLNEYNFMNMVFTKLMYAYYFYFGSTIC